MSNQYDVSCDEGAEAPITLQEFRDDCDLVLREEGVQRDCMVSISVVGDERMRELNKEWRGQDRCTDVLSLECERPDDPDLAPGEPCELGDIVLAPAYIARQAEGFGTTAADEFRLLLVHAMLHLLGYDHLEEDEAQVMEAREDELVSLLSTDAPPRHVTLTRHRGDETS
ncbi:MAG: rRNA maturation RNase YbeY [Olsenella sp.]|jgi:probable rRNA maturation factor|nr:rRNA maturation RNase YbeY [Olsenella sp.]